MGQMARTVATLPKGSRITDFISLGVIAKTFPVRRFMRFWQRPARVVCASEIYPPMWWSIT